MLVLIINDLLIVALKGAICKISSLTDQAGHQPKASVSDDLGMRSINCAAHYTLTMVGISEDIIFHHCFL